ncbi:unnamed protein product, partial [Cyprideis torosa]
QQCIFCSSTSCFVVIEKITMSLISCLLLLWALLADAAQARNAEPTKIGNEPVHLTSDMRIINGGTVGLGSNFQPHVTTTGAATLPVGEKLSQAVGYPRVSDWLCSRLIQTMTANRGSPDMSKKHICALGILQEISAP